MNGRRTVCAAVGRVVAATLAVAMSSAPASAAAADPATEGGPRVVVGSKKFTESVVLGEVLTSLAASAGAAAEHRRELGGTRIVWNALRRGEIDAYVEYTGTLREELFAGRALAGRNALREALAGEGLVAGAPLGFNNTYAIGMREERAAELGVRTISDLARHPELSLGFTNEFLDRGDGWPALRDAYSLTPARVRGLDHDLAYRGLEAGSIDAMDLYSTDAEIRYYALRVLEDDRQHFPEYQALAIWRADLEERAPEVVAAFRRLEGALGNAEMVALNARAKIDRVAEADVAADFLREGLGVAVARSAPGSRHEILQRTREHLALVAISLSAAVLVAVPLGVVAGKRARLGQIILGITGVIQTIPSLALLVIMIPLFGIGSRPAVVALFLYSLLPIVRNTAAGLRGIAPELAESARALGLSPSARLRLIELPLAAPSILAGIKISAVINVGTATLGALIGAGGYGQPILTGIRLDDAGLILQGALPAAALALVVQGLFEAAERWAVPRGVQMTRNEPRRARQRPEAADGGTHLDLAPGVDEFLADVWAGLGADPKTLPCKYFYDEAGSRLFDDICELDEYYVTRTETRILEDHADEMVERLGERCLLLEFGSGSSVKTQLLLDRLESPAAYVPIDISRDHLLATTDELRERYPQIPVLPICADYTSEIRLPAAAVFAGRRAMFFPGSTLGNFDPPVAQELLERIGRLLGRGGLLLLGVDLKKDREVLERAYDDRQGVTAKFNRNILRRINRELDGHFDLDTFEHRARWNEEAGRMEMHLRSDRDQSVNVAGRIFSFEAGETIWTESSYKFTQSAFARLADAAGFQVERIWSDADSLFSVQLLRVESVSALP